MITIETDRKRILEIQKELMTAALEYQILYGSGSIAWNVNIQFIEKGAGENR